MLDTRVRSDIAHQREVDERRYPLNQDVLLARVRAVLGAQDAVRCREAGARYALRASLVDLAACAESLAAGLSAGES